MKRWPTPYDWVAPALEGWAVLAEAQAVVAMRLMGMAGAWPVSASENRRMMMEKGPAMLAAGLAAQRAVLALAPPDRVAMAALEPVRRRTRANARRLAGRAAR